MSVDNKTPYNGPEIAKNWDIRIPRWVDKLPPGYKKYRKVVSVRYGWIILFATIFILLFIAVRQTVVKSHYHSIKRFFRFLNKKRYFSFLRSSIIPRSHVAQIIVFWIIFSLLFTFIQTYDDLLMVTKRLGRIPVTLMPTLFFLTLKPSPIPNTIYLNLLPMHKWISRIVVLQSIIHTILYMAYFYHTGAMKKSVQLKQIYGWIPMVAFIIIAITSLYPIRRKSFSMFFVNHYILSWVLVIFLHLHSRPPATTVTVLNISILLYQIYLRFTNTSLVNIEVHTLSPNLKIIEIPKANIPMGRFQFKYSMLPCSHIRIQRKYTNRLVNIFYRYICPLAHPYSVASVPTDKSILLVLRSTKFELSSKYQYYINGSFDPEFVFMTVEDSERKIINSFINNNFHRWSFIKSMIKKFNSRNIMQDQKFLLKSSNIITLSSMYKIDASRLLMIIGGTGISVALPMLRILNILGIPSRIIWIIKDIEDLKLFKFFKNIDLTSIEVYLTSKSYNFEYLNHNVLRLDNLLFASIENCDRLTHMNKDSSLFEFKNNDYEEEIDFTNFKTNSDAKKNKKFKEQPDTTFPSEIVKPFLGKQFLLNDGTFTQDSFIKKSRSKSFSVTSSLSNKSLSNSNNTNNLEFDYFSHNRGKNTVYSRNPLLQLILNNLNLELPMLSQYSDYLDDDDIKGTNADNVNINISSDSNNYENAELEKKTSRNNSVYKNNYKGKNILLKRESQESNFGGNGISESDSIFLRQVENQNSRNDASGNYGSIESTSTTSQKEEYRLPLILETSANNQKGLSIIKHLKIFKGRPTLGQEDFNWCLNHVCGNDERYFWQRDGHVFEVDFNSNDAELLKMKKRSIKLRRKLAAAKRQMKNAENPDVRALLSDDEENTKVVRSCNAAEHENIDEILKKVWVLGVGPPGLISRAELWATENRLNFHAESFAV